VRRRLTAELRRTATQELVAFNRRADDFSTREGDDLLRSLTHSLQAVVVAGYRMAKVEACEALMAQGMPANNAARLLGIPNPSLWKWRKAFARSGFAGLVPRVLPLARRAVAPSALAARQARAGGRPLSPPSPAAQGQPGQTAEHCGASPEA
jgi:hypothetical protein